MCGWVLKQRGELLNALFRLHDALFEAVELELFLVAEFSCRGGGLTVCGSGSRLRGGLLCGRGGLVHGAGALQVGAVIAVVSLDNVYTAITAEPDDAGGDSVEEIAVVGDDEGAAFKAGEGLFQDAEGGQVEVVGRFVEDDDVATFAEHFGELDAIAFATAEQTDGHAGGLLVEEEAFEPCAEADVPATDVDVFKVSGDFLEHGGVGVECFPGLVRIDELDAGAVVDGALLGFEFLHEQAQKCGLAESIAADDADAVAGAEHEGEVADEGAAVEFVGEAFGFEEGLAEPRAGGDQ